MVAQGHDKGYIFCVVGKDVEVNDFAIALFLKYIKHALKKQVWKMCHVGYVISTKNQRPIPKFAIIFVF
jgi:hypothetical protein